jgi:hypothetical protein
MRIDLRLTYVKIVDFKGKLKAKKTYSGKFVIKQLPAKEISQNSLPSTLTTLFSRN